MNAQMIAPIVRQVLQVVAGGLIASGKLNPTELDTIVGAIMAVGTCAWMLWAKRSQNQTVKPELTNSK